MGRYENYFFILWRNGIFFNPYMRKPPREFTDVHWNSSGKQRALRAALHCAVAEPLTERMLTTFKRKFSRTLPDLRYYFNAIHKSMPLDEDVTPRLLTEQLVGCVNFPLTIERAYEDGVRIFVEIGPRSAICGAISSILEDKPHFAIPPDSRTRAKRIWQ
jgi:acyl transferase domain-containing protein